MSNRQERNRRKAKRRRDKLLSRRYDIEGFDVVSMSFDFGTKFSIALQRRADGLRYASVLYTDRLWRRMDDAPDKMLPRLLEWFRRQPLRTDQLHNGYPEVRP